MFKLYHINCLSYLKLIVSLILFFFAVKITVSSFNYQHERLKTPKFEKPTFGGPQFDIGLIVQHNGKESKGEPPNPPKKGGGGGGPMNGLGFAGTNEGNGWNGGHCAKLGGHGGRGHWGSGHCGSGHGGRGHGGKGRHWNDGGHGGRHGDMLQGWTCVKHGTTAFDCGLVAQFDFDLPDPILFVFIFLY